MVILATLLSVAMHASVLSNGNFIRSYTYLDSTANDSRARINITVFDGMGREVLSVGGATSMPESLTAIRTDYTLHGKIGRKWLPVPGNEDCLDQSTYNSHSSDFYGSDEIKYTEYLYKHLWGGEISEENGPGKYWKDHGKKFSRNVCSESGLYSCSKLLVDESDGSVYVDGVYPAGTLRVTEEVDPDNLRLLKFENRSGKIVLERRVCGDTIADTRYVYDIHGDLRYAVSPEGSALFPQSGEIDAEVIKQYSQSYCYDYKHRVISSALPGCGTIEYVYDKYGQQVFQSDAEQRKSSRWSATFYDDLGRPVLQGIMTLSNKTAAQLRTEFSDSTLRAEMKPYGNGVMQQPTSRIGDFDCLSMTFYDDYEFLKGLDTPVALSTYNEGFSATGLKTGELFIADGGGLNIYRAYKYDPHGNVTLMSDWDWYGQSHKMVVRSEYDFLNQLTAATYSLDLVTEGIVTSSYKARFENCYDDMGRKVIETVSVNDRTPVMVGIYNYDNIGRLINQWRGTDVDYTYDIRSHLTSSTSDVFSEQTKYAVDVNDIENPSFVFINANTETWHDKGVSMPERTLNWRYQYDGLGRLVGSKTTDGTISEMCDIDLDAKVRGVVRKYRSSTVQDAIISFDGALPSGVQDVSSPYYSEEVGRFAPGSYSMTNDDCGRLVSDQSRNISNIFYFEFGNLPKLIRMSDGNYVQNVYASDGTLCRRTFYTEEMTTVTKVNAQGDTITVQRPKSTYKRHYFYGPFEIISSDKYHSRVHTSTGYYDLKDRKHRWYLTNHIGSVMAVIDSTGNVLQRSGLYPSGTPLAIDYANEDTPPFDAYSDRLHIGNRWLGLSGLNWYDNTARMHDPLLMRFSTPDALASKYPATNPWVHCASNPLNLIDADGNRVWKVDELGNFTLVDEKALKDRERFVFVLSTEIVDDKDLVSIDTNEDVIDLPENSVESFKKYNLGEVKIDVLEIRGDENGKKLLEELSIKTEALGFKTEFSLAQTGIEGEKGKNFLSSSHDQSEDQSCGYMFSYQLSYSYNIRTLIHNHPGGTSASGEDLHYMSIVKENLRAKGLNIPNFLIYNVPLKQYDPF